MPQCECVEAHELRRVVLTGGPGAGKTAVLELIRQSFCEHVHVLREAATVVFGGGFPREDDDSCRRAAQRAIFFVQRELENAAEGHRPAIVLCDRGTLDGLAYWPGPAEAFWSSVKSSQDEQLARYQAVIHLRTPALDLGYNQQNPLRTSQQLPLRQSTRAFCKPGRLIPDLYRRSVVGVPGQGGRGVAHPPGRAARVLQAARDSRTSGPRVEDEKGRAPHTMTDHSSEHEHHHDHAAVPAVAPHHEHSGHDRHAGHSVAMFRDRFWITLALTLPTLAWSHMIQEWFGFRAPSFPGSVYIPALFGSAVYLYGGWVFLAGGLRELGDRLPGMMTLISLAISVAFFFSLAVTLGYPGDALWWELATLVTIMLLGHWIEMRSIFQASGALRELAKLLPSTAARIVGDRIEDVPISALNDGDLVLVRPGASIPADGIVRSGRSDVNESMITGESVPVPKTEGARVIAGTVNGAGSLRVDVTGTGERTALANIMRLVEQAQTSRSRAQALADRAAFLLTLIAIGAGAVTFLVWTALGAPGAFAVERVVSVLVVACPHALGLAVPLVIAISTTLGARSGLLVRDRRGLEEARQLTTVVFDKTGTLTRGEFRVVDVVTDGSVDATEALRIAAAIERDSEHTIAQGIVKSAEERQLPASKAEQFEAIPGHGVRAVIDGREFYMGGPAMLRRLEVTPAASVLEAADRAAARGQASVYLLTATSAIAAFAVADAVRPESREAIQRLHEQKIEVVMLTGDAKAVAHTVARDLGIDTVFAEVLPADKVDKVRSLKSQGKRVAMVGDGVNDAPALVTADVAVAIGAGTDVAVEAGDVVLVRSDPRDLPRIIALSRASYRKMVQNLWWAAGYNIFAIPLAAGALARQGVLLPPAFAAVLMSASTVIVAINAQLLRRARL